MREQRRAEINDIVPAFCLIRGVKELTLHQRRVGHQEVDPRASREVSQMRKSEKSQRASASHSPC
eukprot:8611699-Karenia_brevis.AAC.1